MSQGYRVTMVIESLYVHGVEGPSGDDPTCVSGLSTFFQALLGKMSFLPMPTESNLSSPPVFPCPPPANPGKTAHNLPPEMSITALPSHLFKLWFVCKAVPTSPLSCWRAEALCVFTSPHQQSFWKHGQSPFSLAHSLPNVRQQKITTHAK